MPTKRIFIAVDISDETRELAVRHIEEMRGHAGEIRASWERPEKLHVTLKFLGNVEEEQIAKVSDVVTTVSESFRPFEIAISGTGVFPNARQPRVLWLGVENVDQTLAKITADLDVRLAELGFAKEKRRFSPHLTIARIREPQKAKRLAEIHLQSRFDAASFIVAELVVYESELRRTGSVYSVVSRHALAG